MIPALNKLFAVPDLAQYSDEQFERLVIQAKLRRGDAIWVIPLLMGVLTAAVWTGISLGLAWGMAKFSKNTGATMAFNFNTLYFVVGVVLVFATVAATRWMMIVRSIRNIVNRAGCPFCDFSLVGLNVKGGKVTCPECGQDVFLHEQRLTPEDLMTDAQKYAPLPGAGAMGAFLSQDELRSKRPANMKATAKTGKSSPGAGSRFSSG